MRAFNIRPRDYLSKAKVRIKFTYANKFTKKVKLFTIFANDYHCNEIILAHMLLVHRKVIIYSLVSMVFIAASFYISSPDGVFFMSIIGCYFSFLVISRYGFGSDEDYRLKIYAGLQERVKHGIGEKNWNLLCKKKDWPQ